MELAISPIFQVLLSVFAILAVTSLCGTVFKKTGQPAVMGEIVGGILLGPSFLGWLFPEFSLQLFPEVITPQLNTLAQLGIILYMFLIGLEVDLDEMKKQVGPTMTISFISIVVPFALGLILSRLLYENLAPQGLNFISFALFVGTSLSVTAFPVLARILTDQNIHKTRLGKLALSCAAIDDISAWCLLAVVLSFSTPTASSALLTVGLTLIYIALMLFIVRPVLKKKMADTTLQLTERSLALFLGALLLSSMTTELIGIHALFGAFLFGAIIPHDHALAQTIHLRLNEFVRIFFLPVFFAFTGMRTKIHLVNSTGEILLCLLIIAVAILGKFGGTYLAGKLCGLKGKDAATLGILMNTRGLVELIVLNIGLDKGILSPTLYTMLVIMAIFTTFMTGPMLRIIQGNKPWEM